MEMTDAYGHAIFESIRITLVCDDCLRTDHPEKCVDSFQTFNV